jgi:hypothetical protein
MAGRSRSHLLRSRRDRPGRASARRAARGRRWNCEAENGSVRSSFATTINVLEGLSGARACDRWLCRNDRGPARGEEYLLERRLFRRKSTGEVVKPRLAAILVSDPLALRRAASSRSLPLRGSCCRTREWTKRLLWCAPGSSPMAPGCGEHPSGKVHFALEDGDGRPPVDHAPGNCASSAGVNSPHSRSKRRESSPPEHLRAQHLVEGAQRARASYARTARSRTTISSTTLRSIR